MHPHVRSARTVVSGLLAASLGAIVLLAGGSKESAACGNEVEIKVDPRAQAVRNAELDLERGDGQKALRDLRVVLAAKEQIAAADDIERRAFGVAALAIARADGRLQLDGTEAAGEAAPAAALDRAALMSKLVYEKKKDDMTVRSNHAEVLSRIPEHRGAALAMLTELEGADLLATGHAYAALARLRSEAPAGTASWVAPAWVAMRHAPAALATARCERMAKNKEVCRGRGGGGVSSSPPARSRG